MGKVVSSYSSIVRGVSEQVASDRNPGQMYEQVNMISDPVVGLARRPGSVMLAEQVALAGTGMSAAQYGYARGYREFTFYQNGTEYSLLYQTQTRTTGDALPAVYVMNKDTGRFLTVGYVDNAALNSWRYGGISAIAQVGGFIVMASQSLGPGYSTVDNFAASSTHAVAWVRGGSYSRTFTVQVRRATDGVIFTASYTTLTASYPNLLSTADIAQDANYQKNVNDRVNAYNSAVNAWVGQAAQSVQPEFIAQQLASALAAQGFTSQARVGGTMIFDNVTNVTADDGGDGTLFRAVANTLTDPALLSSIHWGGKTIQIKATSASDPYYMNFVLDNPSNGQAWGTGTWREGPGATVTPGQVFALGVVDAGGTNFYMASNAAAMAGVGVSAPTYASSKAGDLTQTGAVPYFFGRRVSMMSVFQDRLFIVSDGVIFGSRVGDYFNFFRKSMLHVDDDDPVEVYALGAQDDIITRSVTYNGSLFMFGQRKQYTINGSNPITPSSVAVNTTASEIGAAGAQPVTVGNLIFYGKSKQMANQTGTSKYAGQLDQFQLGYFQNTPETYRVSQQLNGYMRGKVIELAAMASPNTVFVRTDGNDYGVYVYSYIDQQGAQARSFDSWSRWSYSTNLGPIVGITTYQNTLFIYTLRYTAHDNVTRIVCDQISMDATLSGRPYLDSMRKPTLNNTGSITTTMLATAGNSAWAADLRISCDATQPQFLMGDTLADAGVRYRASNGEAAWSASWLGTVYPSLVDLTPPYVRDSNDKAIVNGRLVVTRYSVSVADTAGLDAMLSRNGAAGEKVSGFNGRVVGLASNTVGRQPVATTVLNIPIGRANEEHRIVYQSRGWLPMTLTSIEWVGQFFNNSRRV